MTTSYPLSSAAFLILSAFLTPTLAHTSSRFQSFFRHSANEFAYLSDVTCNASLTYFRELYANSSAVTAIDLGLNSQQPVIDACKAHESCILSNSSETTKAALATAGVVLGLLPTLLAVLSPSIAEVALLSAQRPVLAMVSSLGSPGLLSSRIFEFADPGELLDTPEELDSHGMRIRLQLVLGPWRKGWLSAVVAIFQWVLILGAVVNTQWLAVELSRKSILSWGCTRAIWPTVLWSCVPLLNNGLGALGYYLTQDPKSRPAIPRAIEVGVEMIKPSRKNTFFTEPATAETSLSTSIIAPTSPSLSTSPIVFRESAPTQTFPSRLAAFVARELIPSACHPIALHSPLTYGKVPSLRVTAGIAIYCFAGFLSFFHLLYGTVTFSGLIFVDILDAIGEIAMRFLVSSLICRFVVLMEIAGMRGAVLANKSFSSPSKRIFMPKAFPSR